MRAWCMCVCGGGGGRVRNTKKVPNFGCYTRGRQGAGRDAEVIWPTATQGSPSSRSFAYVPRFSLLHMSAHQWRLDGKEKKRKKKSKEGKKQERHISFPLLSHRTGASNALHMPLIKHNAGRQGEATSPPPVSCQKTRVGVLFCIPGSLGRISLGSFCFLVPLPRVLPPRPHAYRRCHPRMPPPTSGILVFTVGLSILGVENNTGSDTTGIGGWRFPDRKL